MYEREKFAMIQFVIGLIIGTVLGFAICAFCSMAGADNRLENQQNENYGEEDVGSE